MISKVRDGILIMFRFRFRTTNFVVLIEHLIIEEPWIEGGVVSFGQFLLSFLLFLDSSIMGLFFSFLGLFFLFVFFGPENLREETLLFLLYGFFLRFLRYLMLLRFRLIGLLRLIGRTSLLLFLPPHPLLLFITVRLFHVAIPHILI